MTRTELEARVAIAERGVPAWRARAVAEEIEALLQRSPAIDEPLRVRALAALAKLAPGRPPPEVPRALAPGHAHVLLAGPLGGEVAVVQVRRHGRAGALHTQLPPDVADAARNALEGLVRTLAGAGFGLPNALDAGFEVDLDREPTRIEGASLGLSVAVAALSSLLGQPIAPHVAGTAEVSATGALRPVGHLRAKVTALRRDFPSVREVVVAAGQDGVHDLPADVAIVRAETLADALPRYGLALDRSRLGGPSREQLRALVATFESTVVPDWASERWRELAAQASYAGHVLGARTPDGAAAYGWAALFAMHAGDSANAARLRAQVPDDAVDGLPPRARIAFLIADAVGSVDEPDPDRAITIASRAVVLLEALHPADRVALAGRTHGTLGRVLMRAGKTEAALAEYRRAAEHNRAHLPEAEPRSLCHVATALRVLGRYEEALATVQEAARLNERFAIDSSRAPVTRMFLRYEEGRILLALGQASRAAHVLELCAESQRSDADWPRLGALCALVRAQLFAGRPDLATSALDACVRVAAATSTPHRLRRAAAVGIADAISLADRAPWRDRQGELRALLAGIVDADEVDGLELY